MPRLSGSGSEQVDAYLAPLPAPVRALLVEIRTTVREEAPDAEEVISYGMPAFRLQGMLLYYAAFRDHCSLFVASRPVWSKFASELKPYVAGKGTVRISPEHPLPLGLLRRIVQARVAENAARAQGKGPPRRPRTSKQRRTT